MLGSALDTLVMLHFPNEASSFFILLLLARGWSADPDRKTRTDFVQRPAALMENKIWRGWITFFKK